MSEELAGNISVEIKAMAINQGRSFLDWICFSVKDVIRGKLKLGNTVLKKIKP
jgi:hypothetical protein